MIGQTVLPLVTHKRMSRVLSFTEPGQKAEFVVRLLLFLTGLCIKR